MQKLWQLCWLIQLWWQLGRVAVLAAIAVVAAEIFLADVAVGANVETVTVLATEVVVTGAKPMVTVTIVAKEAVVASSTSCELSFLWHYLHSNLFGEAVLFFCPLRELTLSP